MRPTTVFLAVASALALSVTPAAASAQDGPKIYISADMEGVVGAVSGAQMGPSGFEYSQFREYMTSEVLAAIDGAVEAGASEILVSDSHGNGQNLLIERLPRDVLVVRSWPRPLMMMQGIDETFDGAIFLGYHTSTTNERGVRAHTISSSNLTAVRLNGVPMPEAGINAAIAGHFGVPVLMISGDDAIVEEARALLGAELGGAVVKWSHGFHSATTMVPEAAFDLIRQTARSAVAGAANREPYVLEGPVEIEVAFKNYMPAEILSYLPNVDRVDSHTVRFVGADMIEISKFIEFVVTYRVDLAP